MRLARLIRPCPSSSKRRYDLFRLPDRHAWIVGAMNDEERGGDRVGMVNWRDCFEEVTIVFEAAIFRLTQFTSPGACIFQEGDEVGDTNDVNCGRPEIWIGGQRREDHEAA